MILNDKVVIVTGAGPGLGQTMCRGAARHGARVLVTARSEEAVSAIAANIRADGGDALAVPLDVTSEDQCRAAVQAAIDAWGRIDGLVNSAYYHPDWQALESHSLEQMLRACDVIAGGALRMAQAVIPTMRAQRSGSIVNISTMATRKLMPGEGGYAMAKAALNQLTRQLAVELGGSGIRVNTALMGWMDGVPLEHYFASLNDGGAFRRQRASEVPAGHIPVDADCAKAVYFLLSDMASEMTGAMLDVNGGDWVAA